MLHEVKDSRQAYIDKLQSLQEMIREGAYPQAIIIQLHRIDGTTVTAHKFEENANLFAVLGGLKILERFFLSLIQ